MHFHLPKPLHGWRQLAGEVGIIVLGVLIALTFEQLADEWQWQHKVAVVRRALMGELGNDRARWEYDMSKVRCLTNEVDQVDHWNQAGATGVRPATPMLEAGGFFWMHSANWNLATGSQTLDHFPVDEQLALAALYDGIAHRQIDIIKATDQIDQVLAQAPLASDVQGQRELSGAIGSLRRKIRSLTSNVGYMRRHFDALRVKPDRSDFGADIDDKCVGAT